MSKELALILRILIFASFPIFFTQSTLAQAMLLKEKEDAIFVFGGVGGGENVTVFNLGIGGTYDALFDLGASMGLIRTEDKTYWGLGQSFSILLIKEELTWSSIFLSFDQSFNFANS